MSEITAVLAPAVARPLPERLKIGHMSIRVVVDEDLVEKKGRELQTVLAGFSDWRTQTIGLSPSLAADAMRETLLHEVLHMSLRAAGQDPDADAACGLKDVEERTVMSMSGVLLDVLRANPDLYAYLVEPEGV